MPSSNNPPQLQLSLGLPPPHHAFKRSFHQFGLDVDDADDAEASSAGSSSGSVSTSASGNAGGSRSVSGSGSSTYSSLSSGDAYGHGHNERNKRARSEGPDGVNSGSSVGSGMGAGEQSIEFAGARLGSGSGTGSSGSRQRPVSSQMDAETEAPGEYSFLTPSSTSSTYVDTPAPSWTSPSLPTPSFGPPTPSIADFAASRIRSSAGGLERPPGFSNMLSPRLSSPAPPPAVDMDIVSDDDEGDDISIPSHSFSSRPAHQNHDPSESLSIATDLRTRIARARAFDRSIAPLRSGAPSAALSQSQDVPRPRHPPFDFEAHRRRASPAVSLTMPFGDVRGADTNTSVSSDTSNRLFDHGRDYNEQSIVVEDNTNYYSRSAHMSSPSSLSDESFASASAPASGVPLGAGRFTALGDSPANTRAANMNANMRRTRRLSPEMEPIRFRSAFASDEDEDRRENEEDEEADDIDVDRALVVHGSETDAEAGRTQVRDAGVAGGEVRHDFADFGPFDQNWSSHLTSVLENSRPIAHPGPRWDNIVNRAQSRPQSRGDQTSASSRTHSDVRNRPWPWSPPPPDNEGGPNNSFDSFGTQGLSHAPSRSYAVPHSSAPESSNERIGQMVRLDMGMGIGDAGSAYPYAERTRDRNVSQGVEFRENRAARAPTPPRPNLPTLRSAIFGSDAQSGNTVSSPETEAIRNRFNELREERAQRAARSRREDSALDAWRSEILREDSRTSETVSSSAVSSTEEGLHLGGSRANHEVGSMHMSSQWNSQNHRHTAPSHWRDEQTSSADRSRHESSQTSQTFTSSRSRDAGSTQNFSSASPLSQLIALPPLNFTSSSNSGAAAPPSENPMPAGLSLTIGDLHRTGPDGRSFMESSGVREAAEGLMESLYNAQRNEGERERERQRERERERERERDRERRGIRLNGDIGRIAVERPTLREMRELTRLPIRAHSPYLRRSIASPRESPQNVISASAAPSQWRHSFSSSYSPSSAASNSFDSPASGQHYLRPEDRMEVESTEPLSSTEIAAYFASRPVHGASRHDRGSVDVLRQRRLRLLSELDQDTLTSAQSGDLPTRQSADGHESNVGWRTRQELGHGGGTNEESSGNRSPQTNRRSMHRTNSGNPGHDLLQLLSSGNNRPSALSTGEPSHRERQTLNNQTGTATQIRLRSRELMDEFGLNDLPPLEESRMRTWARAPTTQNNDMQGSGGATGHSQWNTAARSASRPPSLPPLRFDRMPTLEADEESEAMENRSFDSDVPNTRNPPWRGLGWSEGPNHPLWEAHRRAAERTDRIAALRREMFIQSQQPVAQATETERGPTPAAATTTGRTQGFQHAMNVLGSDGLSGTRRQQFTSAFERERERVRPPRGETHVRWGEIADDGRDADRPASWMDAFRRRRNSMSALFAPPPENADNAPPNRARAGAGAAGQRQSQGQGGEQPHSNGPAGTTHDWFAMVSAGRARARQRLRAVRGDDDSPNAVRSFSFRLGRRQGLRNLGDFVRDEDFDTSYESLVALAATLGDAKPRATPAHIISALPTALYKDWQTRDSDTRCPICLDDYKDVDPVLKAEPCNHWCHKECLEQWLHSARTCPVCRTRIDSSRRVPSPPPVAGPSRMSSAAETTDSDSDDDVSFLRSPSLGGSIDSALFAALSSAGDLRGPPS